jgi:hypothetical protein
MPKTWEPEEGEVCLVRPFVNSGGEGRWFVGTVDHIDRDTTQTGGYYFYLVRLHECPRNRRLPDDRCVTVHEKDARPMSAIDALASLVHAWCQCCQIETPVWGEFCRLCWFSSLPERIWRWFCAAR